jgi:hypothetical protein
VAGIARFVELNLVPGQRALPTRARIAHDGGIRKPSAVARAGLVFAASTDVPTGWSIPGQGVGRRIRRRLRRAAHAYRGRPPGRPLYFTWSALRVWAHLGARHSVVPF